LHLLADANAPNLPLAKVATQLNVPGSETASLSVITPVLALTLLAFAVKMLFGGGVVAAIVAAEAREGVGGLAAGGEATVTAWLVDGPVEPVSVSIGVIVHV